MSNINFFKKVKERNMLSHLYLLSGDSLSEKEKLAYEVSSLILSDYDKSDKLLENISNDNHTQVFIVNPQGGNIKKEQILLLQEEFSKTSLIDAPRIYIINDVDLISISAANSLLKFLEEPESLKVYGILTTSNISNVLPTIISRSQIIRIENNITNNVYDYLVNEGMDEFFSKNISYITNSISESESLINNESIINLIDYINDYFSNYNNKNYDHLIKANIMMGNFIFERDKYLLFLELMLKNYSNLYKEIISSNDLSNKNNLSLIKSDIDLIKNEIIKQSAYININLSLDVLMLKLKK